MEKKDIFLLFTVKNEETSTKSKAELANSALNIGVKNGKTEKPPSIISSIILSGLL